MLVKGPPGTGKTTLITEIVKQYLKENPFARILISAQTHIAIDHVIAKLMDVPELREHIVSLARQDEGEVAPAVKPALLHNRVLRWCEEATGRARMFAKERGEAVGLNSSDVELSVRLEMLVLACERLSSIEKALKDSEGQLSVAQSGIALQLDLTKVESADHRDDIVCRVRTRKKAPCGASAPVAAGFRELGENGRALADLPGERAPRLARLARAEQRRMAAIS